MLKTIYIKLIRVSPSAGPFNIFDQFGNNIAQNVSRNDLISGMGYVVDETVSFIRLISSGDCTVSKVMPVVEMTEAELFTTETVLETTACIWRHLTNPVIYNYFYGKIDPYIIEYPFAYEYHDQILGGIKDFTRAYRYFDSPGETPLRVNHVELDNEWFNKAIIYNGQQCSGLLYLTPKPRRSLKNYMLYPIYRTDGKIITYTKSDSYYQYNTFWDVLEDKAQPMFVKSEHSLSIDKELNQTNMNYSYKSFQKAPLRGKDVKVRHILDNKSDLHLVSRLIFASTQISYK